MGQLGGKGDHFIMMNGGSYRHPGATHVRRHLLEHGHRRRRRVRLRRQNIAGSLKKPRLRGGKAADFLPRHGMAAHKDSPRPPAQGSAPRHHRGLDAAYVSNHGPRTQMSGMLLQEGKRPLRRDGQYHQLRLLQHGMHPGSSCFRRADGGHAGCLRRADGIRIPGGPRHPVPFIGGQGQGQRSADQPQPQNKNGQGRLLPAHS